VDAGTDDDGDANGGAREPGGVEDTAGNRGASGVSAPDVKGALGRGPAGGCAAADVDAGLDGADEGRAAACGGGCRPADAIGVWRGGSGVGPDGASSRMSADTPANPAISDAAP
jgi:hypothetical protein